MKNLIRKWQKILGLTDWKIEYEICEELESDGKPRRATINAWPETKEACITFKEGYDGEWLLVHELCHLVYDPQELSEAFFCEKCESLQRRIEDGAVIAFAEIMLRNFGEE
jgi:hypothetical protein